MNAQLQGYFHIKNNDYLDFKSGERVTLTPEFIKRHSAEVIGDVRHFDSILEYVSNISPGGEVGGVAAVAYSDISFYTMGAEVVTYRRKEFEFIAYRDTEKPFVPDWFYEVAGDRYSETRMLGSLMVDNKVVACMPDRSEDIYLDVCYAYKFIGYFIIKLSFTYNKDKFINLCYDGELNFVGVVGTGLDEYFVFDRQYINNRELAKLNLIL